MPAVTTLAPHRSQFSLRNIDRQISIMASLGTAEQAAFIGQLKFAVVSYITTALVKDGKSISRVEQPAIDNAKLRDCIVLARRSVIDDFYRMFPLDRVAADPGSRREVILDVPVSAMKSAKASAS